MLLAGKSPIPSSHRFPWKKVEFLALVLVEMMNWEKMALLIFGGALVSVAVQAAV